MFVSQFQLGAQKGPFRATLDLFESHQRRRWLLRMQHVDKQPKEENIEKEEERAQKTGPRACVQGPSSVGEAALESPRSLST